MIADIIADAIEENKIVVYKPKEKKSLYREVSQEEAEKEYRRTVPNGRRKTHNKDTATVYIERDGYKGRYKTMCMGISPKNWGLDKGAKFFIIQNEEEK